MFLKINRSFLIEELTKCNRIIDQKTPTPSLIGILIDVEVDKVSFMSTNNSLSIKTSTSVGEHGLFIKETGTSLIRGKYFLEILRRMDDEFISINQTETNIMTLSGENSEFTLNILDYKDYPMLAFREKGDQIELSAFELKKSLNQTIISVNEYNQKIVLGGLNFSVIDNQFFVTGTDGFRVSRKRIFIDEEKPSKFEANIPYKSVMEIIKVLPDKGKVKIVLLENHVSFLFNNTVLQTTILEGQFPNVNSVFPSTFASTIYVENKKFLKLISRADIPSDENVSIVVNLKLEGQIIYIKSNIQQIGSFEEEFKDFELKGLDEQDIFFNSKFLIESLKSFETKNVEVSFIDAKKPIVITSSEDDSLSQIILPMFSN